MIGNGRECSNDTDLDGYPDTRLTIGCNDKPVKSCPVVSQTMFSKRNMARELDIWNPYEYNSHDWSQL